MQAQLSQQLYDIRWDDYFPWTFEGHEARVATPQICYDFMQRHSQQFQELDPNTGFLAEMNNRRREKYYEIAGDFFSFHLDNQMIGFFIGTPTDWSTYYFRFVWILRASQKKG